MSTISDKVSNAIMTIHHISNKEWISLKEIYDEMDLENGDSNISSAAIRDAIEKGCSLSVKFSGIERYVSKEKGLGLYKSINYEQIRFIRNINIGDIFTRDQLMAIFKISGQSGMMKTNTLNCMVLTTSENNGVYGDSLMEKGTIIYTGEGLVGDQQLIKNNKTLYESNLTNLPVYLFTKNTERKYIFEGRVTLYEKPYQATEKDINGNERLVWKFPLKVIEIENDNENYEQLDNIVYEIKQIENSIDISETTDEIIFKDGPLNLRKYRKTGRHNKRTSKPDFIAQEIIKNKQGIVNEKYIYENEIKRLMEEEALEQVKIMEDFFKNKKENEGYDILTFEMNESGEYIEKFIEVKSTKGNEGTPIDITSDEIEFAKQHIDNYYLYRIINSESSNRYVKVVTGKDLLSNFNFVPTSYKIYSN